MMTNETKNIREFIYLDVPKLFSLYSQVFEGISEKIVEERITQLITGETQSSFIKQAESDSQALEASRRVESGILHDHMYNRLENKIEQTMIDASKIKNEEIQQKFLECPIIKISGRSEIEDYERLNILLDKFNEISSIIAYSMIAGNQELQASINDLQTKLNSLSGKQKRHIENQLNELKDSKKLAEKQGLAQDPTLLKNLKSFGEIFNPNGYDIVITSNNLPDIHYRGVLNRNWLRIEPQLMRQLFGGQSEAPWSMVGTVTHIQGTFINLSKILENTALQQIQTDENPMMLDSYRLMFRQLRIIERMFIESKVYTEIIVSPIAIYREFQINIG
jgi:hypothetical protein